MNPHHKVTQLTFALRKGMTPCTLMKNRCCASHQHATFHAGDVYLFTMTKIAPISLSVRWMSGDFAVGWNNRKYPLEI